MKIWNVSGVEQRLMLNAGGLTVPPGASFEVSEAEARDLADGMPDRFSVAAPAVVLVPPAPADDKPA